MKTKDELSLIEDERDVDRAITFLDNDKKKELDTYLRVLFLLLDFLVDCQYAADRGDVIALRLLVIYHDAKNRFYNNGDFLFNAAVMILIAENYFKSDALEAERMLAQAELCEPDNLLYQWGSCVLLDNRPEYNSQIKYDLSERILEDHLMLNAIKHQGLFGEYLMGIIESTKAETLQFLSSNKL